MVLMDLTDPVTKLTISSTGWESLHKRRKASRLPSQLLLAFLEVGIDFT
jgi:hypothetical protein